MSRSGPGYVRPPAPSYVPGAPGAPTAPYVPPPYVPGAPGGPPNPFLPPGQGPGHWEQDTEGGGQHWVPEPGAPGGPGNPAGGGSTGDPIQDAIDRFTQNIAPTQYNFANASFQGVDPSGTNANLDQILNQYRQINSADDPRWEAYSTGQNAVLNQQRGQAIQAANQELARTGVVGTAALNDLNRINQGYDVRQLALTGDIGMAQMGRQDAALGQQAGVAQQQFANQVGGSQANNEATRQWLESQAALSASYASDPALRIGALAAQQGGNVGGGGKGGPFGK